MLLFANKIDKMLSSQSRNLLSIRKQICNRSLNLARGLSSALDLSGIFPPIPTPFDRENEDINWNELETNLSKWNNIPFKGESSL